MSDRDVLLVGPPSRALDQAASRWAERSWNVSVFDRPTLERLAEVKALFLQHLKQEGRLLLDEDYYLTSVLGRYSPKADYSAERNDALAQIAALPRAVPNYWQNLCIADIVYVLFRNAAILHLACSKEYHFQFDVLVDRIGDLFNLGRQERLTLIALRNLKHAYRHRVAGLQVRPCILEARQVINRIIEQLPDMRASSIATGATTEDYFKTRMVELELVTRYNPKYLDSLGPDSDMFDVWRRIKSSGGYPKPPIELH